ncbi:hypothetical protein ACFX2A_047782 [Malus domestica]
MLQCIIFPCFICSSGICGIFSSFSSQTLSAELTVHAAFFSACFFRQMWQLLEFFSSDSSAELTVQTAFFSACSFCTLSPHAARYHFHLPYLFFRQMWQLL